NTRQHAIGCQLVAVRHCDVKPSNLLLFGETVKLSDFGLATVTTAPAHKHERCGTLDYAAPEVFLGQVSVTTDQFALAVTYCRVRGGFLPFPTVHAFSETSLSHRGEPDLSPLTTNEQPIVARALARAPQDRWPSCRAFITKLAGLFA